MKNLKKFLAVILTVCIAASMFCFLSFASDEGKNLLLLGDSITEGFGVSNSDEACYGRIVADTNGYHYKNNSMLARDSEMMLWLVQCNTHMRKEIQWADIIILSTGSNDYLANDDVVMLVAGALFGMNNKKLDEIADAYYENLCAILNEIHWLNPDAIVFLQSAYEAWTGFAKKAFSAGALRVNNVMHKYVEQHPDEATYYCDISPAITGHPERLADDCVHPNDQGNIAIAKLVLNQLYELGLGTQTVPVVNAQGENYNYFKTFIPEPFASIVTVIVKVLTGNAKNLFR